MTHTASFPGTIISAKNLHKSYRRGQVTVPALRGIDLAVETGAFVVFIGPSGCGKSTLLNLIGGIDQPSSGSLQVSGVQLEAASQAELTRFRRQHIGFVFQFYNLLPSLNALDNVCLPLLAQGWRWGRARQRSATILAQVGLHQRQKHRPGELSGGEQQRVAIARALAGLPDPPTQALLLADEPTGDLDSVNARTVISLMHELNQRLGVTLLVATHNLTIAQEADQVYEMQDGRIHSWGSPS
ncbi:MAG: ABC transporter ATP-binding protein [Anaerolineales bacterium]|nr:ABC transporter ATP-binding protein [Anaerolineales bacterium]